MNKTLKTIAYSLTSLTTTVAISGAIVGSSDRPAIAREEYYYIQARHSGQCLNVLNSGQDNGDNVVQGYGCNTPNFQWTLIPAERGYYYIRARHSGQCLNVLNRGQDNGDNVVQGYACDTPNFQWTLIPSGGKYNYLEARHSGQCLNVFNSGQNNGDNVVQGYGCDTPNFQWTLIPVGQSRPNRPNSHHRNYDRGYNNRDRHRNY